MVLSCMHKWLPRFAVSTHLRNHIYLLFWLQQYPVFWSCDHHRKKKLNNQTPYIIQDIHTHTSTTYMWFKKQIFLSFKKLKFTEQKPECLNIFGFQGSKNVFLVFKKVDSPVSLTAGLLSTAGCMFVKLFACVDDTSYCDKPVVSLGVDQLLNNGGQTTKMTIFNKGQEDMLNS